VPRVLTKVHIYAPALKRKNTLPTSLHPVTNPVTRIIISLSHHIYRTVIIRKRVPGFYLLLRNRRKIMSFLPFHLSLLTFNLFIQFKVWSYSAYNSPPFICILLYLLHQWPVLCVDRHFTLACRAHVVTTRLVWLLLACLPRCMHRASSHLADEASWSLIFLIYL